MQTSVLFSAKTLDFSKFMVCPHEQEELVLPENILWQKHKPKYA